MERASGLCAALLLPTWCWSTAVRPPTSPDIRKVALVPTGGQAYYPGEIHEALGIRPFTEPVQVVAGSRR